MPKVQPMSAAKGNGQKSPSSKAAALLARGAYSQYVSTVKGRPACAKRFGEGRERRWRLFSPFPSMDSLQTNGMLRVNVRYGHKTPLPNG